MAVVVSRLVPRRAQEEEGGQGPSLLFVNQHYWPDVASTGQHLTDLAEYLAERGYGVHVLASRGRYVRGRLPAPRREERHGVHIHRVPTTGFGRGHLVGRIIDYASFYLQVLWALLAGDHGRRYDLAVFLTTPPLLSFLGALARALRGQRYGVWSMDLHPDAEVASGMLRPTSPLARVLERMNALGLRRAEFVVDLGAYMKRRIVAKGVAEERVHTVPVWSRKEEVEPTERVANPLVDELGLRERFVVMYSGNAGIVHEFGPILDAMRRLRDEPRLFWLFVGDGPRRPEIELFIRANSISNAAYRDYFTRDQLRFSLSLADIHLISLREPFVGISVPGKLYGIMASGRPALFVGPPASDSAESIVAAGAGIIVDSRSPDAGATLAGHVQRLMANPGAIAAMGARGRAAFLERYDRETNCAAFERVISESLLLARRQTAQGFFQ